MFVLDARKNQDSTGDADAGTQNPFGDCFDSFRTFVASSVLLLRSSEPRVDFLQDGFTLDTKHRDSWDIYDRSSGLNLE